MAQKMLKLRKIAWVILINAICIFCGAGSVLAATTGTVSDNGVNVRAGSSTSAKIITKVNAGQVVNITGKSGDFYHVYFKGVDDGYIAAQFVTAKEKVEETVATPIAAPVTATVATPVTPAVASGTSKAEGKTNGSNINIRSTPSSDGKVLGKAAKGQVFTVLEDQGKWYKIEYNNTVAYISSEFLDVPQSAALAAKPEATVATTTVAAAVEPKKETTPTIVERDAPDEEAIPADSLEDNASPDDSIYAVVMSDTGLYLRQQPSTDANVLNALAMGEVLDVIMLDSEWVGVKYGSQSGYVSAEFVTVARGQKPASTAVAGGSPLANEIIEYGKQFLGTPYVWGGTSLTGGVDCSGFVYAVMRNFGISLNRSSRDMLANGPVIQKSQLQPGDLVFFDTDNTNNGQISHVGIYMGSGKFIHSSSSTRTWGVTISNLNDDYYSIRYVAGNRVLPQ